MASGLSAWTSTKALDFNRQASADTQRANLFWQFQNQYNAVAGRFPARLLDPTFAPEDGTDDYGRLEAYWLFAFSEWYATQRVNPEAFNDLWRGYYVPLIADGLEIASLRHVLEDMIVTNKMKHGDFNNFLVEIGRIAREAGIPLSAQAEAKLAAIRRSGSRDGD